MHIAYAHTYTCTLYKLLQMHRRNLARRVLKDHFPMFSWSLFSCFSFTATLTKSRNDSPERRWVEFSFSCPPLFLFLPLFLHLLISSYMGRICFPSAVSVLTRLSLANAISRKAIWAENWCRFPIGDETEQSAGNALSILSNKTLIDSQRSHRSMRRVMISYLPHLDVLLDAIGTMPARGHSQTVSWANPLSFVGPVGENPHLCRVSTVAQAAVSTVSVKCPKRSKLFGVRCDRR